MVDGSTGKILCRLFSVPNEARCPESGTPDDELSELEPYGTTEKPVFTGHSLFAAVCS